MTEIRFQDIRDDWYKANQLLPRLFRKALRDRTCISFTGFPRQWIPIFEHYGLKWGRTRPPREHMPIVSELSDGELTKFCHLARTNGTLRTMVEAVVTLDPVLADFLYILDHTIDHEISPQLPESEIRPAKSVRLTNWQSYGRPEVRSLEREIDSIVAQKRIALILPCSRRRPYDLSRTHRRLWIELNRRGYSQSAVHKIVITSLGVLPEELWSHPVVLSYDAGVPDIYRTLRLARRFFSRNRYREVVDCLEFKPYSDVLRILKQERTIRALVEGPARHGRHFYVSHGIRRKTNCRGAIG